MNLGSLFGRKTKKRVCSRNVRNEENRRNFVPESGKVGPTGGGQNRSINLLHLNVHKTKGHFKTLHVHFLFNLPTTAHCDLSAFA